MINNSIAASVPRASLLQQRASNELPEINAVATRYAKRYAIVPLLKNEPVGVDRLLELTAGNRALPERV